MVTKLMKFNDAKTRTLEKWKEVHRLVQKAKFMSCTRCTFCEISDDCNSCPAGDVCCDSAHIEAVHALTKVRSKLSLLIKEIEKVEYGHVPVSMESK